LQATLPDGWNGDVIPTIDLAPFASGAAHLDERASVVADELDTALRDVGFVTVVGHGVDAEVKARYFAAMRQFFDQPLDAKQAIAIGNSRYHRGYVGFEAESLEGALGNDEDAIGSAAVGDLKETLDTGTEYAVDHPLVVAGTPLHGPNQWPDLPGFRAAYDEYRSAAVEVALRTQRAMALALGLDTDFFEGQPGDTMFHLRLIHYPPQSRVTPTPGQLGCGAHTDYGTLTVLADDGVGGLQVRLRSGEWVDVSVPDGHLVVNIGDLMAIWTNDRWVSNPHRVVNPVGVDRYSSALFVTPPFHARIETLPTCLDLRAGVGREPLVAGPYLLSRFDGTHAYRA
jgi:isopenicillin N synthase-like dioxygenase